MQYLKNRKKEKQIESDINADIEKLLIDHAWIKISCCLSRAWRRKHYRLEVDWDSLDISHVATYEDNRDHGMKTVSVEDRTTDPSETKVGPSTSAAVKAAPGGEAKESKNMVGKSRCLFSSVFTNESDDPQTFSFIAERTTTARCEVTLEKEFRLGLDTNFKLPLDWCSTGKLSGELHLTHKKVQTFEEALKWSVNHKVVVARRKKVTASLVISENEKVAKLTITTTIKPNSDKIDFEVWCIKTGLFVKSFHIHKEDLIGILNNAKVQGIEVVKDSNKLIEVKLVKKGVARLVYGVEQVTRITTSDISPVNECKANDIDADAQAKADDLESH